MTTPTATPRPQVLRATRSSAGFEIGAAVCTLTALAAAFVALALLGFATSSCGEDSGAQLAKLRLGMALIGAGVAAVPALFGSIARRRGASGSGWLGVAGVIAAGTAVLVMSTDDVAHWCYG